MTVRRSKAAVAGIGVVVLATCTTVAMASALKSSSQAIVPTTASAVSVIGPGVPTGPYVLPATTPTTTASAAAPYLKQPFVATDVPGLATSVAAKFGDANPSSMTYAQGTREEANAVMTGGRDDVPDSTPSYLVVMQGAFSSAPPIYPGEPATAIPAVDKWSVEMLVVDAATGQVTDSGGSNVYPNLRELGAVTHVAVRAANVRRNIRRMRVRAFGMR